MRGVMVEESKLRELKTVNGEEARRTSEASKADA
jgi:hypothetical protein